MRGVRHGQADTRPVDGRWAAVVTSAAALLVLGLVAGGLWLVGPRGGGPPPGAAPPVTTSPPTTTVDPAVLRLQALDQLLDSRAAAITTRDRTAWLATVDGSSQEFAQRQAAAFDNLAQVPLAGWRYEYAGEGAALAPERAAALGPDAWVARVVLVYRLDGEGLSDVRREQDLTLVRRGEAWLVADDRDGQTAPDLWDLGPVHVARGDRSLVLGTGPQDSLARYVTEADRAAEHVDGVWGAQWPRTVVVMVPSSQGEMARLLRRADEAGLDQVAAVTTGEVGLDRGGTSADRVIINPAGFAQLGDIGRRVVLTHEITHVATRATTTQDVPIWLSEGFADYVAYTGADVARQVIAQDLLDLVRAGQTPAALPGPDDFDPARGTIAPAYSGSWLAAELIARRWGDERLVAFYRAVASGTPTSEAFAQVLATDEATFTADWQAYLTELAS